MTSQLWKPRRYRYPLDKIETPYYKFGSIYASGAWKGKPHPGVDFHKVFGAWVYAIGEGKVVKVGDDPRGYGFYTMIEHRPGPVYSLYAHLSTPAMWGEGALLEGQDIHIGFEGTTGASGGTSHLHFEIKKTFELGLYPQLTVDNLTQFYHDPYIFLSQETFLPVHCWVCPHRKN